MVTVGQIVHYMLPSGRSAGEVRAAAVVRVWDASGLVNLQLWLDGSNDDNQEAWRTSVRFDAGGAHGTWHWPPREGAPAAAPASSDAPTSPVTEKTGTDDTRAPGGAAPELTTDQPTKKTRGGKR